MKSRFVLAAGALLATTAFTAVSAQAALLEITGGANVTVPYGTVANQNNVVNTLSAPISRSGLVDNRTDLNGVWRGSAVNSPAQLRVNPAEATDATLRYWFNGAESGFTDILSAGTIQKAENNENNRIDFPSNQPGPEQLSPTLTASAGSLVPISFYRGSVAPANLLVSNGPGNVQGGQAGIIFQYVTLGQSAGGANPTWFLSNEPTNLIAFGLDDGGAGPDRDFDDWMGVIVATPVPISAALPLLLSGLAALGIVSRRRV